MKPTVEQVIEKYFPESPEDYDIESYKFHRGLAQLVEHLYQEAYDDGSLNMFVTLNSGEDLA